MSLFRLIEGYVSTRPRKPLGNFASETVEVAATDKEFDFGGLRKDVHIESNQPFTIKFNSDSAPAMTVAPGAWDWTDQFANKAFVTFTAPSTNFGVMANG